MIVYVLSSGENGEGGSVTGVFRTREAAVRAVGKETGKELEWLEEKVYCSSQPKRTSRWTAWLNRVDYVEIERMEVRR